MSEIPGERCFRARHNPGPCLQKNGPFGEFRQRQVTRHWMTAVQYSQYSSCMLWKPIGSMYGIYTNIGDILMVNDTIYSIHGSYGKEDVWINFPGQKLQWIYLHCLGSTVTVLTSHEYLKKKKYQITFSWSGQRLDVTSKIFWQSIISCTYDKLL